ncbi:hypothetical protein [Saccharothrix australiensis]|uniref:Uncharacterized protein n=1 Tax=Saccharothrix australiensis TaxID=2072 RepID=A0A495VYD2_9PSEU|nr:hypothetical protein [Saccharothrix australiensis]RKT54259.1 hypothetical protein C8E97_2875 [Saccharothrix australiensis]
MTARRGIIRRAFDWMFGTGETAPAPPMRTVEYAPPADEEPVVVYAEGGILTFRLLPTFRWSSSAVGYDELVGLAARYHGAARSTLLDRVWTTARGHRPDDLAAAEDAINEVLAREWCFDDEHHGRIGYRSSVRALLDPQLREHILPAEKRRLDLVFDHDLAMLRADHVEERTARWLAAIARLEDAGPLDGHARQLLVPFAANLADQQFAEVMHALGAKRGQLARDLVSVLRLARTDHEGVGLYEFANAYDKAVRAFCRQMGLDPYGWTAGVSSVEGGES